MTRVERGILDTSVLIDLLSIPESQLPADIVITTLSVAELAAGPHATSDVGERAARQERLQWVEATFDPLPFDTAAARAYGRVYAAVRVAGRSTRRRVIDLQIAAVAASHDLPVITRNPTDFAGLDEVVRVIGV